MAGWPKKKAVFSSCSNQGARLELIPKPEYPKGERRRYHLKIRTAENRGGIFGPSPHIMRVYLSCDYIYIQGPQRKNYNDNIPIHI
jgi:hypothetical protein